MKNNTGKVIVFLIILISLLLVFTSDVNAQTPTPPTRDSLIQAIQQRAQKDVELRAAPQSPTDLAVLFSEQATVVGMSMSEVKDIYDEAYKAATPAKSPWDDLFKPQGGWIFVIFGIVLTILAGIAKDYLIVFFKKIAEDAYHRLARFRPFWMIALRRYRKSLEATYHELKIPFRSGRPLQMQDIYVPVRVEGGTKQQVDAYQTIQGQKRLIVLGDPGSGKTMLLRHIAFTYARQGLYDFPEHPIPVYLELNRVESAGNSLIEALTKSLENHNFPGADGFIKSQLEKKSLLILLDGLDEVNASARPALVDQINDLWQKYPDNRILVTCRIAVYQGEIDDWVDQKLEIIEFSDQQIQRFMTSWQKDMPAEKSIEHFFRTLQERPQIMALARNPLLLTMVAYLYTDTEFALPHSRSEFYSRSTDLLLEQWKLDRNHFKATHKRIVLQRLALFNQTKTGNKGERRMLELADVLKEIRDVIPDLTLKTEDAQPILDEIVQRSGLMLAIDGGTRYQFTHLTLQEYFAARALESEPQKLLNYYRATPDAWREVMRLWCALEHDSTAMLKELNILDPVMAFECLSDAQQVDNAYTEALIQSFQPRLHEAHENDSLASAFALLAADPRPRGKKWLNFIEGKLNDEQNRLAACAVLARTNIPQVAEPLAKLAATRSDVIPFLVQLGNLAVPALTEPAQKGETWGMDALVDIGTPQAALALQPLLWTYEPQAYHAAWRLAALLSLPGVEDGLKTVTLTPEQRKAQQIEWVWEPFSDDLNLRAITGRIAYLLHATTESNLPTRALRCHPHLALALCTVVENIYRSFDDNDRKELRRQIYDKTSLPMDGLKPQIDHSSLDKQEQKNILDAFSSQLSKNQMLQSIYSALDTVMQFDLLCRLALENISPTENDWRNHNKPVNYDFATNWHVKVLKLLLLLFVVLDLLGIGMQIHLAIFTWQNIPSILFGTLLVISTIWAQKQKWTINALESWFFVPVLGFSGAFGFVAGEMTQSWDIGSLVGALVGLLVVALYFIFDIALTGDNLRIALSSALGSTLGIAIGGAVGGTVGGVVGGAVGGAVGLAIVVGKDLSNTWLLVPIVALFIALEMILIYFPTNLLYELSGLSIIIVIFWFAWLGSFSLFYFIGAHFERRAQNPLYGLLQHSGAAVSLRHSSSFLSRWFWFR